MEKFAIEKLRLRTRMSDALHVLKISVLEGQRRVAVENLRMLQEEYKSIAGEYSAEHVLEEKKHRWTVTSAKREDGYAFNTGDPYTDDNGKDFTIKEMWVTEHGDVMAEAEDGGVVNLWTVKVKKV